LDFVKLEFCQNTWRLLTKQTARSV